MIEQEPPPRSGEEKRRREAVKEKRNRWNLRSVEVLMNFR